MALNCFVTENGVDYAVWFLRKGGKKVFQAAGKMPVSEQISAPL